MSTAGLVSLLQTRKLRIFTTRDILSFTDMAPSAVTQSLFRLEKQKILARIKRGLWVNRLVERLNPYEAVPFLVSPWPAYVSLHTALADYGIIAEVPHIITAVTSYLPKNYTTPLGSFHFHHLPKQFIWGYEVKPFGQGSYPIAEPEKAFLDLVYLSLAPRSPIQMAHKRSRKWKIKKEKLKAYAARFKYPPLTKYLRQAGLI